MNRTKKFAWDIAAKMVRFARKALFVFFWLLPIKKNKIVFTSFFGKYCNDNPYAICNSLKKKKDQFDFVWALNDLSKAPKGMRAVKYGSLRYIYELATAKVWVNNARMPAWVKKRKGQFYIQTWHGEACIKAVEKDAQEKLSENYIRAAKNDSQMADLFISGSKWRTRNYREAFWYDGEILESGYPRSDVYFNNRRNTIEKVRNSFGIKEDVRVALYAPTFRNSKSTKAYNLDCPTFLSALEQRFGGHWILLIRLHPNIAEKAECFSYSDRVLNATAYPEINELILAAEVLISDYSGCLFDAFQIGLKVFLYASDYEEYIGHDRSLYFDIKSLPAPFAESNEQLTKNVLEFEEQEYERRLKVFADDIGFYNRDGKSSEIVADQIGNYMNLSGER